ncbi:MAG: glycosyltransferase family 4 protein [Hyphomonadaceae bacterium]
MSKPHRPRVLILVENLPLPFDRRVWMEAQSLQQNGYDVSVICPKGKGFDKSYERINDVDIYRFALPVEARGLAVYAIEYSWALLSFFWLALNVARKGRIDVIQACNPPDLMFLVAAPFKPFGAKFIFDHHDLMPELLDSKYEKPPRLARAFLLALERWTFALADVSIATNESYKKVAVDRGKMRPERVYVVRSGPRRDWIKPVASAAPSKIVGYVGVMGDQEGIDLLLLAAAQLVFTMGRSDIRFVLVGDGGARQDLEGQAVELGLGDFVTFTGRVSDQELKDLLSRADILVNPDRPSELNDKSTMNKIVEYMAMAKPTVQFDCTEGRFSAQDASLYAKPGDYVDFALKIASLLDDPDQRRRMGEAGRRRFEEELCWERQEPKLLQAYAQALGRETVAELAPQANSSERVERVASEAP